MPIVIKELFSSDPISEALEKINFNFDQLILSGGGPPGPAGPLGPPGVAGSQGVRGDHWQVGVTAPTGDHGPNYGNLEVGDSWIDAVGKVWTWNGSIWVYSSVNLTGPTGSVGPTGNSLDLNMYQGGAGGQGGYVPLVGPTTVPGPGANFWIINNMDLNSFFLGNKNWAYSKLKNFNTRDAVNGISTTPAQRMIPKQVIIQSGIDFTGYGGLSIGAYGLTGGTATSSTDFIGGSAQPGIVDGRAFFNAGWGLNNLGTNLNPVFEHAFKMITGYNDMEIQSGSNDNTGTVQTGNVNRKLSLTSGTINLQGFAQLDGGGDVIRLALGATYGRHRDRLLIGFNTTQISTDYALLTAVDNSCKLYVNGYSFLNGETFITDVTNPGAQNRLNIGYGLPSDATAKIVLYTEGAGNTNPNFLIQRNSGIFGTAFIQQYGFGTFFLQSSQGSISLKAKDVGGSILFGDYSGSETARFDVQNRRLGVGVTPLTRVHIKGTGATPKILRLEGFSGAQSGAQLEFFAQGPSVSSGWVGFDTASNSLGVLNSISGGNSFFGTFSGSTFYYASLESNGVFAVGSNTIIGSTTMQERVININGTNGLSSIYLGDNLYQPNDAWKIGNNNLGHLLIANGPYASTTTRMLIKKNGMVEIGDLISPQSSPEFILTIGRTSGQTIFLMENSGPGNTTNYIKLYKQNSSNPFGWVGIGDTLGQIEFVGRRLRSSFTTYDHVTSRISAKSESNWWSNTPTLTYSSDLRFETTESGQANMTVKMLIKGNGNVGIGNITPDVKFYVYGGKRSNTASYANLNTFIAGLDVGLGIGHYDGSSIGGYGTWLQSVRSDDHIEPMHLQPMGHPLIVGKNADVLRLIGNTTVYTELYLGGSRAGWMGFGSAGNNELYLTNEKALGDVSLIATNSSGSSNTIFKVNHAGVKMANTTMEGLGQFTVDAGTYDNRVMKTIAAVDYDRVIYFYHAANYNSKAKGFMRIMIYVSGSSVASFCFNDSNYSFANVMNNASYILPAGQTSTVNISAGGLDTFANSVVYQMNAHKLGLS